MSLLCECGIHNWGKWEYVDGVGRFICFGLPIGDEFYLEMKRRECKRCGLVQEREKED